MFNTGIVLLAECFVLEYPYWVHVLEYSYWMNVLCWNIPTGGIFCTGIPLLPELFCTGIPLLAE
jgi:hypothetical protein